jgi:hypothetical protein
VCYACDFAGMQSLLSCTYPWFERARYREVCRWLFGMMCTRCVDGIAACRHRLQPAGGCGLQAAMRDRHTGRGESIADLFLARRCRRLGRMSGEFSGPRGGIPTQYVLNSGQADYPAPPHAGLAKVTTVHPRGLHAPLPRPLCLVSTPHVQRSECVESAAAARLSSYWRPSC